MIYEKFKMIALVALLINIIAGCGNSGGPSIDDEGMALDGEFRMVFKIYEDSTANDLLWAEPYILIQNWKRMVLFEHQPPVVPNILKSDMEV